MKKPTSGWFMHRSSTTRSEEHTWGIFRAKMLQHFEASNYQAVLREKLQRLKQTMDIESYNGEYSALIFRVEGMRMLDQVLCYANWLKPRTRSYAKLENPGTLSDAMDLAVKCEVRTTRESANPAKPRNDLQQTRRPAKANHSRENYSEEEKPGHIKANCFVWKKQQVYKSRPLFSVTGAINMSCRNIASQSMLLDCGATTTYVSKRWVETHQLQTTKFGEKNILVKLGDNQIIETELEVLPLDIVVSGIHEAYKCVAVVFSIHDEFDCILGIPFFEDMQPQIDWRSRRIEGKKLGPRLFAGNEQARPTGRSMKADR
ncbi:hypothetical protein PC117_g18790 [Phytophthora cactorum]|uniref:Ty3 transposon capsid-like protein domain-containing protein n=2 Tax=Phytophthora cactorum TaxID=29920 RepID=A0A8T1C1J1_9STRA|nr:hypothetical protein PC117_g18790 [Phytophthora cactorum]